MMRTITSKQIDVVIAIVINLNTEIPRKRVAARRKERRRVEKKREEEKRRGKRKRREERKGERGEVR